MGLQIGIGVNPNMMEVHVDVVPVWYDVSEVLDVRFIFGIVVVHDDFVHG